MTVCDQRCGCGCRDPDAICPCEDRRGPWHPHNPAGLPAIAYRAGDFASFRHDLVRHRPGEIALADWRPTADSDLALQVLDWWAYVADALTFYNERIANEAYLGTALLPGSVARLVALLGYRPRPGIGAIATLAVLASRPERLVLPERFAVQSKARPGNEPQTFELTAGVTFETPASAPGEPPEDLVNAATAGAPPATAPRGTAEPPPHEQLLVRGGVLVKGKPTSVAVGDRLLLIAEPWTTANDPAVVVKVTGLVAEKDPHGRTNTRVLLSGTGALPSSAKAKDYRLRRATHESHLVTLPAGATVVSSTLLVLDGTARFLKAGQPLLLELPGAGTGVSPGSGFDLVRCTSYEEVIWFANGNVSNPTTVPPGVTGIPLVVARLGIAAHSGATLSATYGSRVKEVVIRSGWVDAGTLLDTPVARLSGLPAKLTLARPAPVAAGVAHRAIVEDARGHGTPVTATPAAGTSEVAVAPSAGGTVPDLQPPLRLLWDLVTVTRGESVRDEQLGIGDAAAPGQDFKLSRSPVTYLADGTDPAQAGKRGSHSGEGYSSTIELVVDGVRWTEVPMLFGRGPGERVFATYEDEEGKTHVVTGDGVAGARLPTSAPVSASYRIGSGAAVPEAGTLSQVLKPAPNLAGVRNPVAAVGGADPDPREKLRALAPRSVLTFGRAVSHDDYAAVAALAPGVARAAAAWSWDPGEQRALVRVWVGDDDGAVAAARTALREQADPNRPIVVLPAVGQATTVRLSLRLDPAYVADDVVAAVREALTALFAPGVLRIGEPLYRSRLEAACDLPGVLGVHAVLLGYDFDYWVWHWEIDTPGPRWSPGEGGYFALQSLDIGWRWTRVADLQVHDGYEQHAAAKLWALLPEVHRAADSTSLDEPGPLRELLERVADEVAIVRRSLDRLWEDQSIESCDSWVIPYLAALVDTNLVPTTDARGQRLDVANTINYRRRKGTLSLVEQLAADVTGWECRAVEFFRRLVRRRHGLDPALGWPADAEDPAGARRLQRAQRLVGPLTGTPAGGFADLRDAAGATQAFGPFDEYHHRVDVRPGRGALGWYGIPKLGLFLWTEQSLFADRATPVPVTGCARHFAFDPTGRQVALWQADDRSPSGFGERWRALDVFQVPGPLTGAVLDAFPGEPLWPGSLSVSSLGAGVPLDQAQVRVWPEVGRFALQNGAPASVEVGYHYGLFARIGAGPYDRRRLGTPAFEDPEPVTHVAGGSATDLRDALAALGTEGTVVVTDGLTSTAVASPPAIADVCVCAADERRAVVRLAPADGPWVFQGDAAPGAATAKLRLEGVLLSGQDVVLRGGFEEVVLSCCTFDPGTAGDLREPPVTWEPAVDGRELRPTRIWIEGTVRCLLVDRCIAAPIRARQGGVVEAVSVRDSVLQGLPGDPGPALSPADVFDPDGLLSVLNHQRDALTTWLTAQLSAGAQAAIAGHADGTPVSPNPLATVVSALNAVIAGPLIYDSARFAARRISDEAVAEALAAPTGPALAALNRRLLAEALPLELHDAALALETGVTRLERTTVLGRIYVHRVECSESILDDVAVIDDTQDGCVRFSAWSTGSLLPRKYESVRVAPGAPLFASRRFGEAGYAQLARGADAAILDATTAGPPSIREGSHDGAEMGAGCRDAAAVKERSLRIKLDEFLPIGLTPVLIPMPPPDPDGETTRGRPWPPT